MASARSLLISIGSCLYAVFKDDSSFVIVLMKGQRKLVALLSLSYKCIVTIDVLWLFLTVPWVGLQCVIVVFPDHTHLLFDVTTLVLVLCGYRIKFPRARI